MRNGDGRHGVETYIWKLILTEVKNERNATMLKSIIKAVATPERLSGYAADGIQRGVNGTADETAATVAMGVTAVQNFVK